MEFNISKEQNEYVQEIKQFASANLNTDIDHFDLRIWKKIADTGLFFFNLEERYGGLKESYLTMALCIEALGYSCKNNGLVFAVNNHLWVAQNLIHLYGSDLQKEKYLKRMASGELIGCFALTEADTGSDALNMATTVVESEDGYVLNGSKMFVSNGPIANLFVVAAKNGNGKPGFTTLLVERDFAGVLVGEDIKKMGLHSCLTSEIAFDNVSIPKENVLGRYGMGELIITATLEWERCFECAPHVGAMQRIMEQCITYALQRKQHGKSIIEYQGVSHKIADMKVAIELSKLMLYEIAWLKDKKRNAFLETSVFKLYVSENYVKTCENAMQIFGGYGYCEEYGIEKELRDALASTIYSGTSEIQRNTICDMATVF